MGLGRCLVRVQRWLGPLTGSSSDPSDPGPCIHWCTPIELKERGKERKIGMGGLDLLFISPSFNLHILSYNHSNLALTTLAPHGRNDCPIFLQASVSADITVTVVEITVPLATVFATEGWVSGRDGGVRVPLPDGDGPHSLFAVPIARQGGVALGRGERERWQHRG